jgi:FeS assembly SUF system regulator
MIRMRKLTDYGIVLLAHLARNPARAPYNARCLASEAHLPVPTVSKILKALARAGLLVAHRGVKGGFSLARRPEEISMAQIISAMEGPIAITECSDDVPRLCKLEPWCPVGTNWQKINRAVWHALENIRLSEMTCSLRGGFPPLVARGTILESRREQ